MTDENKQPGQRPQIPATEEQLYSSLRVPTHFVNQFTIAVNDTIVKFIFSERVTADTDRAEPRCAVAMDKGMAILLRQAIDDFLKAEKGLK